MPPSCIFRRDVRSWSALSQRAADETLPMRNAFALLFFVSVGMLFDPATRVRGAPADATLLILILGKSVAAFVIVLPSAGRSRPR